MDRYSIIEEKAKREIVLLRGGGCVYKKCAFCDYYKDSSPDQAENFALNQSVLEMVTGRYKNLEVINSGSVFELDEDTLAFLKSICRKKQIGTLHFESHYLYRSRIQELRRRFADFTLKLKLGLETFDYEFREKVLKKGIPERSPEIIAQEFEEANFLFGIAGQTLAGMERDIELGLKYFERICINLMCENSTDVRPDPKVIDAFLIHLYPRCQKENKVDVLIDKKDFGVGD